MKRFALHTCWLLAACSDSPAAAPVDHSAHFDVEAADAEFKGCPSDIPRFALGMSAEGSAGQSASLTTAVPAPPLRYLNDWTITIRDADGEPLDDVRITKVRPFMPVHGHDGNIAPRVSALPEPGQFAIDGLNLIMRGPWEIQLSTSSPSAGDDYIVFHVCVME